MATQLRSADQILALARSRTPGDRERLLLAVADLCETGDCMTADAQAIIQDIFMDLVVQAEREIRQRLAEKLATAAWAPHALVSILALDDIEIARPIIAGSPVLQDADLIRLLVEATLEHQIEVARRPGIGAPVVSAILDSSQPAVLAALAANAAAKVTPLQMKRMVEASRRVAAMRGPLARHPGLDASLAHTLYGWVGDALRSSIGERFTIDPALLSTSVSEAVADAFTGAATPIASPSNVGSEHEREEMERRLIGKLEAAGQLRPGYLLRALREGRRSLFENALAVLGGYDARHIRKVIVADRADLLAGACAGVGIDRSVFPTILSLVRGLNHGSPVSGPESAERVAAAFKGSPAEAAERFRAEAGAI